MKLLSDFIAVGLLLVAARCFGAPSTPTDPANSADDISLFDGRTLRGWKQSDFTGSGKVRVDNGSIVLGSGYMTGITWTNTPPRKDYEISLEAMRIEGSDFFCGLTFPFGDSACSLIVGGWGGSLVGLSSLDYADAANNESTKFMPFENGRWYKIRLRVKSDRITAWVDNKELVNIETTGRKVSIRLECEPSLPLGVATWSTTAAIKQIKLRYL
jgi:3-keto-disaccharide hydrolase